MGRCPPHCPPVTRSRGRVAPGVRARRPGTVRSGCTCTCRSAPSAAATATSTPTPPRSWAVPPRPRAPRARRTPGPRSRRYAGPAGSSGDRDLAGLVGLLRRGYADAVAAGGPGRGWSRRSATSSGWSRVRRSPPRPTPTACPSRTSSGSGREGINRISFGMQSSVGHVLRTLDRTHDPLRVPGVVADARASEAEQVSLDLIYGTPGRAGRLGGLAGRPRWPARRTTCRRTPSSSRTAPRSRGGSAGASCRCPTTTTWPTSTSWPTSG